METFDLEMNLKRTFAIIILLNLLVGLESIAQSTYFGVWLDYNQSNNLKNNWYIESDYGYRFRLDYTNNWQRLHARSGIGYTFTKVKVEGGLGLFLVYEPHQVTDFELRPWQGVKYNWPNINRIVLKHFVRLEERFHFFESNSTKGYNYFELKFRYAFTLLYSFNKTQNHINEWTGIFGFEPFFNLYVNKEPISVAKSRTSLGLLYSFSKRTKIRLLYIYEPNTIPILQDLDTYSNNFRISFFQKF